MAVFGSLHTRLPRKKCSTFVGRSKRLIPTEAVAHRDRSLVLGAHGCCQRAAHARRGVADRTLFAALHESNLVDSSQLRRPLPGQIAAHRDRNITPMKAA